MRFARRGLELEEPDEPERADDGQPRVPALTF